jgi:hypothetical protein
VQKASKKLHPCIFLYLNDFDEALFTWPLGLDLPNRSCYDFGNFTLTQQTFSLDLKFSPPARAGTHKEYDAINAEEV